MIKIVPYYASRLGVVRDAKIGDVFNLAPHVREEDKREVWRSHHHTPEEALRVGYTDSSLCFTVERRESPIAMFGAVPHTLLGTTATVWLMTSPVVDEVARAFAKWSPWFIGHMLEHYPLLMNYVDVENRVSIKWLRWCGAEFGMVMKYGAERMPFQYFQFRRKHNV